MNLSNHFLIAMPSIDDPFFEDSVVYICQHDQDGAMGIIINKPSPVTMDLIFAVTSKHMPRRFQHERVMMGGPVQINRGYVLHTPIGNWQSSLTITDQIALTTSRDIIEKLAVEDSVDKALVSIGYASWSAGQLESELADNAWLTIPADENILFELPYEARYQAAFAKLGINPSLLMKDAGHA